MARELSRSERRLAILAVFVLFWGAFLVALGVAAPLVAVVLGALLATALLGIGAPRLARALSPRAERAVRRTLAAGRAADAAALRGLRATSARVGRIDWASHRATLRGGTAAAVAQGRRADAVSLRGARAVGARVAGIDWASHRTTVRSGTAAAVARGRAADAAASRAFHAAVAPVRTIDWEGLGGSLRSRSGSALGRGRELTAAALERAHAARRSLAAQQQEPQPGRANALRLNERAAALRQEGRFQEALEAGERALAIFRVLGDRHGQALTLNGLGLTQARLGDEPGALDSYEAAVALLTDLGDSHGAGRVLANLGALHRIQGDDEQARAVWHDALERLEPGTPEHDRTAEQLRLAS